MWSYLWRGRGRGPAFLPRGLATFISRPRRQIATLPRCCHFYAPNPHFFFCLLLHADPTPPSFGHLTTSTRGETIVRHIASLAKTIAHVRVNNLHYQRNSSAPRYWRHITVASWQGLDPIDKRNPHSRQSRGVTVQIDVSSAAYGTLSRATADEVWKCPLNRQVAKTLLIVFTPDIEYQQRFRTSTLPLYLWNMENIPDGDSVSNDTSVKVGKETHATNLMLFLVFTLLSGGLIGECRAVCSKIIRQTERSNVFILRYRSIVCWSADPFLLYLPLPHPHPTAAPSSLVSSSFDHLSCPASLLPVNAMRTLSNKACNG